jgi:hypothetical protein
MTALAIYLGIGTANQALLWNCFGRPRGTDWLWVLPIIVFWPLIALFAIYMALSDSGR